ncbi:unnamed protein product, partial [Nesidiocoris tenuis]
VPYTVQQQLLKTLTFLNVNQPNNGLLDGPSTKSADTSTNQRRPHHHQSASLNSPPQAQPTSQSSWCSDRMWSSIAAILYSNLYCLFSTALFRANPVTAISIAFKPLLASHQCRISIIRHSPRTWSSASAEHPAYGPEVRPAAVHGNIVPARIVISPQFCRLTPGQPFSERSDPVLARIREAKSLLGGQASPIIDRLQPGWSETISPLRLPELGHPRSVKDNFDRSTRQFSPPIFPKTCLGRPAHVFGPSSFYFLIKVRVAKQGFILLNSPPSHIKTLNPPLRSDYCF